MAVYVDDFYKTGIKFRNMRMSHMMADTREELLQMVRKIGMSPKWIQDKDTQREHFDVCMVKRQLAIQKGAIAVGMREMPAIWQNRDMTKYNAKSHACKTSNPS